jgi:8-oxo-dGTP diphosphatase
MKFKELYEGIKIPSTRVAIHNKEGNILLLQRGHTDPWMPLKWNLVGGGVDKGETPIEGAKREIQEESSLIIDELEYMEKFLDGKYDIYTYLAYSDTDIVKLSDNEHVNYKWVTNTDMYKYDCIPFTKEIVELAFNTLHDQ